MQSKRLVIRFQCKPLFFYLLALIAILYEPMQFILPRQYTYLFVFLSVGMVLALFFGFQRDASKQSYALAAVFLLVVLNGLLKEHYPSNTITMLSLYIGCIALFLHRSEFSIVFQLKLIRMFIVFYYIVFAGVLLQLLLPSVYNALILSRYPVYNQENMTRFLSDGLWLSFFNNPAKLAGFAVYAFAFALFIPSSVKNRSARYFVLLSSLLCVVMTAKRAFVLFGVIALLTVRIRYAPPGRRLGKLFKYLFLILLLLALVDLFLRFYTGETLIEVVSDFFRVSSEDISSSRFEYWDAAKMLFRQNPLTGVGWIQFKNRLGRFHLIPNHVHNIYLQLLCETGIVFATGTFVILLRNFIIAVRSLRHLYRNDPLANTDELPLKKGLLLSSLYIQLFFLLYGITGNPLYDVMFFVPYAIACAIGGQSFMEK